MLDFVLFFTASRMASLMVGTSVVYVIVYLAVPAAFLRIERAATGRRDRASLASFLKNGIPPTALTPIALTRAAPRPSVQPVRSAPLFLKRDAYATSSWR